MDSAHMKENKEKRSSEENAAERAEEEIAAEKAEISKKFVGAHMSMEGGLDKVFGRMKMVGGKAVALFLKNQRTFKTKDLTREEIDSFAKESQGYIQHVLPHASYLMNLAQSDEAKWKRSTGIFVEEMRRCEVLGIPCLNFHPGSNVGDVPIEDACRFVSEAINIAHSRTKEVVAVIENMAGQGKVIGKTFKEIKMIINGVKDKTRVGVCLDTCHLFGAGYDIRTKESFGRVMEEFEKEVGTEYLKGVHMNDSKMPLGSRKDRHESIGKGLIGIEAFSYIMNSAYFNEIPLILETPDPSKYSEEIKLLYSLISDEECK